MKRKAAAVLLILAMFLGVFRQTAFAEGNESEPVMAEAAMEADTEREAEELELTEPSVSSGENGESLQEEQENISLEETDTEASKETDIESEEDVVSAEGMENQEASGQDKELTTVSEASENSLEGFRFFAKSPASTEAEIPLSFEKQASGDYILYYPVSNFGRQMTGSSKLIVRAGEDKEFSVGYISYVTGSAGEASEQAINGEVTIANFYRALTVFEESLKTGTIPYSDTLTIRQGEESCTIHVRLYNDFFINSIRGANASSYPWKQDENSPNDYYTVVTKGEEVKFQLHGGVCDGMFYVGPNGEKYFSSFEIINTDETEKAAYSAALGTEEERLERRMGNGGFSYTFSEAGDKEIRFRIYNDTIIGKQIEERTYTLHVKVLETSPFPVVNDFTLNEDVVIALNKNAIINQGEPCVLKVRTENTNPEYTAYQWKVTAKAVEGAVKEQWTYDTEFYKGLKLVSCNVTNTIDGFAFSTQGSLRINAIPVTLNQPVITKQPESGEYERGTPALPLEVEVDKSALGIGTSVKYQWFQNKAESTDGGTEIEGATEYAYYPPTDQAGDIWYYCSVKFVYKDIESPLALSNPAKVTVRELSLGMEGAGTAESPYLIRESSNLVRMREIVEGGNSLEGIYFRFANDITLPEDWVPIGLKTKNGGDTSFSDPTLTDYGVNLLPFSGSLDGGGYQVTVPKGGSPLFGHVRKAEIRNLNIYGEEINGFGLIDRYYIDYGFLGKYAAGGENVPRTVTIENCRIISGTKIHYSGFIGGEASGRNEVDIRNCTVEAGVIIGYGLDQDTQADSSPNGWGSIVGSFAGRFSGTVVNCTSAATVYSKGTGGGLVGKKGQSMGPCEILNSSFTGTVKAKGIAGGILGVGYSSANSPAVNIENCYVSGDITGRAAGGILGEEGHIVQSWGNGVGGITDNVFAGRLHGETNVGAITGYIHSLNKNYVISNNYYLDSCGASNGIGKVVYIDTSNPDHETASGTEYFNTAEALPGISGVDLMDHNRTDDPLGKDADKLAKAVTKEELGDGTVVALLNNSDTSLHNWIQGSAGYPVHSDKPIAYKLEVSGEYKNKYLIGEELDLSGIALTATWTDGSTTKPSLSDVKVTGFDKNVRGEQTVVLTYGAAKAELTVVVLLPEGQITVNFAVMGDIQHNSEKDGNVHTLTAQNLTEWAAAKDYTVSNNATVWDVLQRVMKENGITAETNTGSGTLYVESLTKKGVTIGEFTNGKNSGWMFTVNGVHGGLGVAQQYLNDGDIIVFHYTDDYTREKDSIGGTTAAAVIALIDALPDVDKLTLNDEAAVAKARDAFASLSEEEKAKVPAEKREKLNAAVLKIAELKKAQADSTENIYRTVGNYLAGVLKGNEIFGMEWPVIGLARAGRTADINQDAYYAGVVGTLKKNGSAKLSGTKSTENSRLILALTALGYDVTDVAGYNLLAPLADLEYVKQQGINGPIWALIAFDSHGYEVPAVTGGGVQVTRENLIQTILDARLPDGGWALSGSVSDPDMTAMALQALAPYYSSNADVKNAVNGAIDRLSTLQNADGSYSSWDTTNSESCSQVVTALAALGINPATDSRFVKNGNSVLDALLAFHVAGSGFEHVAGGGANGMASEQGYYALAAYFRMVNGQTSLYDMSDVEIRKNTENPEAKVYRIMEGTDGLWTVNADGSISIRADGELADFVRLEIDGKVVDPSNYTLKAGSTIVTLKPEFLKTLGKGDHRVTFVYKDGEVSMTLPLGESGTPIKKAASGTKTGDENQPEALVAMLFASAACMAAVLYWKRKRELAEK